MLWCMDRTQRFPRNYRGTLTKWIEDQLWGILDLLIEAAYTRHKLPLLQQSNLRLQKLRFLIRLCKDRECLSLSQYDHIRIRRTTSPSRQPLMERPTRVFAERLCGS